MRFDDPVSGTGVIGYGGVEWMRAGSGVWHGREMVLGDCESVQRYQLWIALPPEIENAHSEGQFIEAQYIPVSGPVHVIVGTHAGLKSPVRAPIGITYLLLTRPWRRLDLSTTRRTGKNY
jgi:redox-sensitive bicupin YhaK (pirin superfamily)